MKCTALGLKARILQRQIKPNPRPNLYNNLLYPDPYPKPYPNIYPRMCRATIHCRASIRLPIFTNQHEM